MNYATDTTTYKIIWQLRFVSLIYFGGLFVFILLFILGQRLSFEENIFIIFFITLEYIFSVIACSSFTKNKIRKNFLNKSLYLIYTIISLPITIYISQFYTHSVFALLRYTLTLILIFSIYSKNLRAIYLHIFLVFSGLLFFIFFREHDFFPIFQITNLIYYSLITILIFLANNIYKSLYLKYFYNFLNLKKIIKENKNTNETLNKVLYEIGVIDSNKILSKNNYKNLKLKNENFQNAYYFVIKFDFSDLNKSLIEMVNSKNTKDSQTEIVKFFIQEWYIYQDFIFKIFNKFSLIKMPDADTFVFALKLNPINSNKNNKLILLSNEIKIIFEIYFEITKIINFTHKTRNSLEMRAHTGWYLNTFLIIEKMWVFKKSLENPTLIFRGELIKKINVMQESIYKSLKIDNFNINNKINNNNNNILHNDHIWLHPSLTKIFKTYFDYSTAPKIDNYIAPEFLLSDYTNERSSLNPNSKFWANIGDEEIL